MHTRRCWLQLASTAAVGSLAACRGANDVNSPSADGASSLSLVGADVHEYCLRHTAAQSDVMRAIAEETQASIDDWEMMVGPLNATLLRTLVRLSRAQRVIELGTFTGYSAIAMAEALPAQGRVVTCDISEEWTAIGKRHWAKSPHGSKIQLELRPALETLETLASGEPFDLAFVDADKANYANYWDRLVPMLRPGGVLVVDNVLWGGAVLDPPDETTASIARFNEHAAADDRMEAVMLPVRDGVTVATRVA